MGSSCSGACVGGMEEVARVACGCSHTHNPHNSGQGLGPEVTVYCTKPGIGVSIAVTELDEKGNGT